MIVTPVVLTSGERDPSDLVAEVTRQFGACLLHRDVQRVGAAASTRNAIALAAESRQNVLFCEDDVELSSCTARLVSQLQWPEGVGVISLCDMRELPQGAHPGLYTRDPMGCDSRGWWGNQAMLIRADVAARLSYLPWRAHTNDLPGVRAHAENWGDWGNNCSDIRMAHLVSLMGLQYAVLVPSLVRHVGVRSNCFPGRAVGLGERETRNWIGDLLDSTYPAGFRYVQFCGAPSRPQIADHTTRAVERHLNNVMT